MRYLGKVVYSQGYQEFESLPLRQFFYYKGNMKKILIITTTNDLSVDLFSTKDILNLVDVYFLFFHEKLNVIKDKLESNSFDFVYIRDPFTSYYNKDELNIKLDFIICNIKSAYLIDNLESIKDIYFEDKWVQYKIFSEYMPKTYLLSDSNSNNISNYIIKKRISSRGKGIFFNNKDVAQSNIDDYIIQERIIIEKEYRVYVIFNEIINIVSIKSSKTENNKIKIIGNEKINTGLNNFVKKIITNNKFDFIGLDIAFSKGYYYLIELNRSPQFNAFYKQTNNNLAEYFISKLISNS